MRMPNWLPFPSTSKSEELGKVRRRTDQILKSQELKKNRGSNKREKC
jgi:hypothetical protein